VGTVFYGCVNFDSHAKEKKKHSNFFPTDNEQKYGCDFLCIDALFCCCFFSIG
jgi:hypothetical protein